MGARHAGPLRFGLLNPYGWIVAVYEMVGGHGVLGPYGWIVAVYEMVGGHGVLGPYGVDWVSVSARSMVLPMLKYFASG